MCLSTCWGTCSSTYSGTCLPPTTYFPPRGRPTAAALRPPCATHGPPSRFLAEIKIFEDGPIRYPRGRVDKALDRQALHLPGEYQKKSCWRGQGVLRHAGGAGGAPQTSLILGQYRRVLSVIFVRWQVARCQDGPPRWGGEGVCREEADGHGGGGRVAKSFKNSTDTTLS